MKKFFSEGIYNEKEEIKIRNAHKKLPAFKSENA